MSDPGAVIADRVWRGYSIAAGRLGASHQHYRPRDILAPIGPASRLGALPAAFDPSATLQFNAAPKRDGETRSALVDGNRVAVGDYLVGPTGTYFITSRQPLLPIQAVICNATVDLFRNVAPVAVGAVGYGHDTRTVEAATARGWPASLTMRGGGGVGESNIPGAPSDPNMLLILPVLPGAARLDTGDAVTDELARRFIVTAAERSAAGWRAVVRLVAGG